MYLCNWKKKKSQGTSHSHCYSISILRLIGWGQIKTMECFYFLTISIQLNFISASPSTAILEPGTLWWLYRKPHKICRLSQGWKVKNNYIFKAHCKVQMLAQLYFNIPLRGQEWILLCASYLPLTYQGCQCHWQFYM